MTEQWQQSSQDYSLKIFVFNQMETIHIPLKQAMLLTKAVYMWERVNNKDGDRGKRNNFNLNKENLIMLKELLDVTSELQENCKCHHRK